LNAKEWSSFADSSPVSIHSDAIYGTALVGYLNAIGQYDTGTAPGRQGLDGFLRQGDGDDSRGRFIAGDEGKALDKLAPLTDRFGKLSSLSALGVNVEQTTSVTLLAAARQEVGGSTVAAVPASTQNPVQTDYPSQALPGDPSASQQATPGAAPTATVVIPQTSTGTV